MGELISHRAAVEKDARKAVGGIIKDWSLTAGFRVQSDKVVTGKVSQHTFDFVAADEGNVIAVNVLAPGSGGLARAERYGYQSFDIAGTPEGSWKKMAILSRPDDWSYEARNLIKKFAEKVVDYHNPQNDREPISQSLDELRAA
jgi:hypothetical protein